MFSKKGAGVALGAGAIGAGAVVGSKYRQRAKEALKNKP